MWPGRLSTLRSLLVAAVFCLPEGAPLPSSQSEVSVVSVEGVVGESVSLPCHIAPPRGDRVAVILWYRQHHPDALYTYDARSPGRQQHSSRAPGLRASFHADPPARLVLPRATTKLAGEYECRVDYLHAPSATTKVRLSVVELPASLELLTHDGLPAPPQLEVNMGAELQLLCTVVGGLPRPRVWWTLGDHVLRQSLSDESTSTPRPSRPPYTSSALNYSVVYPLAEGSSTPAARSLASAEADEAVLTAPLTISKVQRHHHGAVVACHASNTNLTDMTLHSATTLLVNTPPSSVTISGVPSTVAAGDRLRAWCSAPHARPSPVLVWALARRGKPAKVLARQELSERNVSRSWLDLEAEWQDDGAELSCTAHSPAVPALQISNSSMLSVTFAPRVRLSLGEVLSADDIKEGTDVYFRCDIHSNPAPSRIAWFHNGQQVEADDRVLVSGDHLVLQKVHRRWSGSFACSASNAIGEATSNSLEIAIQYAPVCGRPRPVVYRAAVGQQVTLVCAVLANPTNVTFQWAFTNAFPQTLPSPGYSLASSPQVTTSLPPPGITGGVRSALGLEGRLKYQLQRVQDYGSVECKASNSVGTQAVPCVFTVRPPGMPSSKFECKVTKQTWASVEIACSEAPPLSSTNATDRTPPNKKLPQQLHTKHVHSNTKNSIQGRGPKKNSDSKWSTTLEKDALGVKTWNGKDPREQVKNTHSLGLDAELRADELQQQAGTGVDEASSDDAAYMLTVRERLTNTLMHNTTGVRGVFNLTGLTPGADYVIRVWRVNRRGRSQPLTLETFTLRTAENRMREDSESSRATVLGAVLAAVGLVLLLSVTAVLLTLRNRHATAARAQFLQATSPDDQDSPNTLIPPGEQQHPGKAPHDHIIEKGTPDLLGSERKTSSGATFERDFPDSSRFYQASSSLYSAITPVSSVSTSNNSTLSKGADTKTDSLAVSSRMPSQGGQGSSRHLESPYEYTPSVFGSAPPGLDSSPTTSDDGRPGEAGDCLRELERQRGVGVPSRAAQGRAAELRPQYVRSHQLTQLAHERESFL